MQRGAPSMCPKTSLCAGVTVARTASLPQRRRWWCVAPSSALRRGFLAMWGLANVLCHGHRLPSQPADEEPVPASRKPPMPHACSASTVLQAARRDFSSGYDSIYRCNTCSALDSSEHALAVALGEADWCSQESSPNLPHASSAPGAAWDVHSGMCFPALDPSGWLVGVDLLDDEPWFDSPLATPHRVTAYLPPLSLPASAADGQTKQTSAPGLTKNWGSAASRQAMGTPTRQLSAASVPDPAILSTSSLVDVPGHAIS